MYPCLLHSSSQSSSISYLCMWNPDHHQGAARLAVIVPRMRVLHWVKAPRKPGSLWAALPSAAPLPSPFDTALEQLFANHVASPVRKQQPGAYLGYTQQREVQDHHHHAPHLAYHMHCFCAGSTYLKPEARLQYPLMKTHDGIAKVMCLQIMTLLVSNRAVPSDMGCLCIGSAKAVGQKEGEVVRVLSLARANNVAIMLTRFADLREPTDMVTAILTASNCLTQDRLALLLQVFTKSTSQFHFANKTAVPRCIHAHANAANEAPMPPKLDLRI